MNTKLFLMLVALLPLALGQDYDDRGLHKKKRRPHYSQSSPCGGFRDNGVAASDDGRSIKLVAALGGAAAGYYLGMKHQNHQQPVINNIINTNGGGGYPCGGGGGGNYPAQGGGHLGSHLGGGGLLGSHLGNGGILGSHFGGNRNGVNWDRTIRQFNRQVIRPLTHFF